VIVTRSGGVVEVISAHEQDRVEHRWASGVRQGDASITIPTAEHGNDKSFHAVRGEVSEGGVKHNGGVPVCSP
jgi:hypothetical protein